MMQQVRVDPALQAMLDQSLLQGVTTVDQVPHSFLEHTVRVQGELCINVSSSAPLL